MLEVVTAARFDKPMGVGKTTPALVTCDREDGREVEVVVKWANASEAGIGALRREALAALLAADLDLPVPEPFLVATEAEFAATIPASDEKRRIVRDHAAKSVGINFGSKLLPPGFTTIGVDRALNRALLPVAAEILAFDVFLNNPDRTVSNPNCQSNGRELAIFDHELAFVTEGVLFWRPPWEDGSIEFPVRQPPEIRHVFLEEVRGTKVDFDRLGGAFDVVTAERLEAYRIALPPQWLGVEDAVAPILDYIAALKANIDSAIKNLAQALA